VADLDPVWDGERGTARGGHWCGDTWRWKGRQAALAPSLGSRASGGKKEAVRERGPRAEAGESAPVSASPRVGESRWGPVGAGPSAGQR